MSKINLIHDDFTHEEVEAKSGVEYWTLEVGDLNAQAIFRADFIAFDNLMRWIIATIGYDAELAVSIDIRRIRCE